MMPSKVPSNLSGAPAPKGWNELDVLFGFKQFHLIYQSMP